MLYCIIYCKRKMTKHLMECRALWHKLTDERFHVTVAEHCSLTFHAFPCFIKQAASAVTETVTESLDLGVKSLYCTFLAVPEMSSHFQCTMQTINVRMTPVILCYIHPVSHVYPSVCHFKSDVKKTK